MLNWGILGHEWAVQLLSQHVVQQTYRQAYLLTGAESVGRRTLALRFAQALNCPQPTAPGEPCQVCRTCTQIERMLHPDLSIVQSEQVGGTIKVDQIRELQHRLSLAPYEASHRFALLLRFEEANENAANALLKTLEEPAPQVVMVLTASSAELLLPTIVSRCEIIRLRPLSVLALSQGLQTQFEISSEEADFLAHLSEGRPGYAIRLHREPERSAQRRAWLDDQQRLLSANRIERFAYAESLSKDKDVLRQVLAVWLSYWRDVMLSTNDGSPSFVNLDRAQEIKLLADRLDRQSAIKYLGALQRTRDLLDKNINARLAAEVLMLDLPRI